MSTQSPFGGRAAQAFPTLPRGDVLGTFETYQEAQRVVARLAESDFPVGKLAIVGNDLKTVERVTGKMTYGRAAIAGALSGLWLGIFFGIVLTLFSSQASGLILAAALIGAAFGVLYGVVSFSITKRQRDFTSVHQVLATNYQIICDPALTGQAQQVLAGSGGLRQGAGGFGPGGQQGGFGPGSGSGYGPGAGHGGAGYGGQPGGSSHPGPAGHVPGQSGPTAPHGPQGGAQGSPYGGDATRHEPTTPPSRPSTSGGLRDEHGGPRYGTNEGPRYGETPETSPASAPESSSDEDASSSRPSSEPPRYGERSGE